MSKTQDDAGGDDEGHGALGLKKSTESSLKFSGSTRMGYHKSYDMLLIHELIWMTKHENIPKQSKTSLQQSLFHMFMFCLGT